MRLSPEFVRVEVGGRPLYLNAFDIWTVQVGTPCTVRTRDGNFYQVGEGDVAELVRKLGLGEDGS